MFKIEMPVGKTAELTRRAGKNSHSLVRGVSYCLYVGTRGGKMVGTDEKPIQIDEALFAGRQKYNQGRVLEGNAPAMSNDEEADM